MLSDAGLMFLRLELLFLIYRLGAVYNRPYIMWHSLFNDSLDVGQYLNCFRHNSEKDRMQDSPSRHEAKRTPLLLQEIRTIRMKETLKFALTPPCSSTAARNQDDHFGSGEFKIGSQFILTEPASARP